MKLVSVLLLLTIGSHTNDGYRILGLFPHPALSHFKAFQPLLKGLANAGHEVIVVSHFPDKNPPPNYHDYVLDQSEILTGAFSVDEAYAPRTLYNYYLEFISLAEWGTDACEHLLTSKYIDILFELNNKHQFDALITEYFDTDCVLGIAYKLNITNFIGMSSCALMPWHYDRVGLPDTPSYIPNEFVGYSQEMSFMERFTNWIVTKMVKHGYRNVQVKDNESLRKRFGPGIPDLKELATRTSLLFVNQHFSFSGPRPLPPNVIEIGGIHIKESIKPLPHDLQQLLDNATNGVIYVSWGSIIQSQGMSLTTKREIVKAFERLPQTILWKWDDPMIEHLNKAATNIHIQNWYPQIDILCHPNVVAFMSHGGLMGTSESVYCQVPTIVTPIYGDQYLNAAALKYRGMGIILHFNQLNEQNIYNSIQQILQSRFKDKAIEISHSYRNRLTDPLDTAIWWVEFVVANNGGRKLLQSHCVKLNWFNYHSLDVISVLLCSMIVTILILIKVIAFGIKNIKSFVKGNKSITTTTKATNNSTLNNSNIKRD